MTLVLYFINGIKMKKGLLYWLTFLMVAIVSVGFVSCGNDDDDNNTNHNKEQASTSKIKY